MPSLLARLLTRALRLKPFSFDAPPQVGTQGCDCCAAVHTTSRGVVLSGEVPFAMYWLAWYPEHDEAWLDVTLGSFAEPDFADHVTFGSRFGLATMRGKETAAFSLVPAATMIDDAPELGAKLTPDEARAHPRIAEYWALMDWLTVNDPVAHDHIHHFTPTAAE